MLETTCALKVSCSWEGGGGGSYNYFPMLCEVTTGTVPVSRLHGYFCGTVAILAQAVQMPESEHLVGLSRGLLLRARSYLIEKSFHEQRATNSARLAC